MYFTEVCPNMAADKKRYIIVPETVLEEHWLIQTFGDGDTHFVARTTKQYGEKIKGLFEEQV